MNLWCLKIKYEVNLFAKEWLPVGEKELSSLRLGQKSLESKITSVMFHKHICFLCQRSYEEVESVRCEYIHDHRWGKCPRCENNFPVGKTRNV